MIGYRPDVRADSGLAWHSQLVALADLRGSPDPRVDGRLRSSSPPGDHDSHSARPRLAEREPDWAVGREAVDRMIEEIGGIPEHASAWARTTLGLDQGAPLASTPWRH
jgi:hypothetical protein